MKKLTIIEICLGISLLTVLAFWIIWATCGITISNFFLNGARPESAGQWADSFGAFNALVSSLAFGGVIITLILQGRSIRQQQLDSDRQLKDQHKQQFDNTFFQLLSLMREVRSEVFFKYSPEYIEATGKTSTEVARGAEALSRAAREVCYWIRERDKNNSLSKIQLDRIYTTKVHRRHESRLGPYYRIIYTILRRISEDDVLNYQDKCRYGNLLRSQLQGREVALLALNGLTEASNDFQRYLVEFRMMKYLPMKDIRRILLVAYPREAFDARD